MSEHNFVVVKNAIRYELLPSLLTDGHPGFATSPEYSGLVDDGAEDLPGVVLGRYGVYLIRLLEDDSPDIPAAFELLEALSEADEEIATAVVEEILEVRDEGKDLLRKFRARLGPTCARLYDQHCKPI
jgi:hypothetical protein